MLDDDFKKLFNNVKENKRKIDFFDIIGIKENIISKWLEFIFNPTTNGVGNLPLSKLLELTNNEYNLDEFEFIESQLELLTDDLKRIDIVIKYKGLWFVIENKIDSLENDEQTNDYYRYIENIKDKNKIIYIYLKPDYNLSLPINKNFIVVTYNQLLNKFKEIRKFDFYDMEIYKYFEEFIICGGRFMKNEEIEITDSIEFYLKNQDKFENIRNEYLNKNEQLIKKISQDIVDHLNKNEKYKYKYKFYINNKPYIQIYKSNWNNQNNQGIHFELTFPNKFILGKNVTVNIALHIEKNITEEIWKNLNNVDILKTSALGCSYKDKEIKKSLSLNFSSKVDIDKSIKTICENFKEFSDNYQNIIDKSVSF